MIKSASDDNGSEETSRVNSNPVIAAEYFYKDDFSDPFFCKVFMAENSPSIDTKKGKVKLLVTEEISLPPCSLGGIVYNEENPMVLFNAGTKSILAKQGDVIDSITIDKIGKDSVSLIYKGKRFVIGK
jgi:type II secretory pathway component PulC